MRCMESRGGGQLRERVVLGYANLRASQALHQTLGVAYEERPTVVVLHPHQPNFPHVGAAPLASLPHPLRHGDPRPELSQATRRGAALVPSRASAVLFAAWHALTR